MEEDSDAGYLKYLHQLIPLETTPGVSAGLSELIAAKSLGVNDVVYRMI
jgi:hypothetical protein